MPVDDATAEYLRGVEFDNILWYYHLGKKLDDRIIEIAPAGGGGGTVGPAGPMGPTGPQGPPGADGTNVSYVHNQSSPNATWAVAHNLGKYPSVSVVDTGNNQVIPNVSYVDMNNVLVNFGSATSGKAYLS